MSCCTSPSIATALCEGCQHVLKLVVIEESEKLEVVVAVSMERAQKNDKGLVSVPVREAAIRWVAPIAGGGLGQSLVQKLTSASVPAPNALFYFAL